MYIKTSELTTHPKNPQNSENMLRSWAPLCFYSAKRKVFISYREKSIDVLLSHLKPTTTRVLFYFLLLHVVSSPCIASPSSSWIAGPSYDSLIIFLFLFLVLPRDHCLSKLEHCSRMVTTMFWDVITRTR